MAFKKDDVIIIEPREMFVGNIDAPVTLMEFGEYESEECAKVNEVVKQLLEEYCEAGFLTGRKSVQSGEWKEDDAGA